MEDQEQTVLKLIDELGAGNIPIIKVYNKVDAYKGPLLKDGICISALRGTNLDLLKNAVIGALNGDVLETTYYSRYLS
jgi:GTP-binding protein HflX